LRFKVGFISTISSPPLSRSHNKSKTATVASDDHSLHLTHALIVVGFLIGFSLVFGVGILYTKVVKVRRFKLLDNRGET
jgi:hypothetical protein